MLNSRTIYEWFVSYSFGSDHICTWHRSILFTSRHNNESFQAVNSELEKICDWFHANKLSLNEGKTKYIFFHRYRNRVDIPRKLPPLVRSIKFFGVVFDKNLNFNEHLNTIENKVSKNIGILQKANEIINTKLLGSLYYSFIPWT